MERYCQWVWKGLLARYEMLGLVMRNFEEAGEVTPRMTWSVLNHIFIPSIVSHGSLFD